MKKSREKSSGFEERRFSYSLFVREWKYYYSYIADPESAEELDEFIHLETLELLGEVVGPVRSDKAIIRIAGERSVPEGAPPAGVRPVIGNVHLLKGRFDAYCILPNTHLTRLVAVAASDRIKVVTIMATRAVRKRLLIRSVSISTELLDGTAR